jgi:uncharacterized protein
MTPGELIDRTAAHVRATLAGDAAGHDWWHVYRVWQTARRLALAEGADLLVVELSALLHDIADWKFHDGDLTAGPRAARAWLETLDVDPSLVDHVVEIIATMSFKGAEVPTPMRSLEGRVVQDADRLDAIGAIGVARAFAYGGSKGRAIYDPAVLPERHATSSAYLGSTAPTINHFYEKLLLLCDLMGTRTARRWAAARHQFMERYLEQFFAEWHGSDEPSESTPPPASRS